MEQTRGTTTRERLVQAARQCLLERGHQAASIKAIAEQAGVNHGLVHHYFGSKEQLWLAVVQSEAERLRESIPAEREHFVDGFYLPELLRHPDRARLAQELLALARALPSVALALCEQFRINRQLIRQRFGLADEATATLAFAALFGLAIQGSLDNELAVEPAARMLVRLLAAGASPDAAGTSPRRRGARRR